MLKDDMRNGPNSAHTPHAMAHAYTKYNASCAPKEDLP